MIRLAAALALIGVPVVAEEPPCAPVQDMQNELADNFREHQVGIGLDSRGFVMMLFLSEAGTWTVIYALPDGRACMAAAGTDMMLAPAAEIFGEDG